MGPAHVVRTITDEDDVAAGRDLERGHRVGDDLCFDRTDAVEFGPADREKVLREPEVLDDLAGVDQRLRGRDRQSASGIV